MTSSPKLSADTGTAAGADDLIGTIRQAWSDRLEHAVGRDDNFFLLGGTSVDAAAITAELTRRLGRRIKLTALLRHPTPAGFAHALLADDTDERRPGSRRAARRAARAARAASAVLAALPAGPPPSPLQLERLQHYAERGIDNDAMINAYDIDGEFDAALLESALRTVVARHDGLRMRFTSTLDALDYTGSIADLQQVQAHVENGPGAVGVEATSGCPDDTELDRLLAEFARAPMDLAGGPRVRLLIVPRGGSRTCVALAIDHLVCDPYSLTIVLDEWTAAYAALAAGRDPAGVLAPDPPSYRRYCVAQWERVAIDPARLAFWSDIFRPDGIFPSSVLPGLAGPDPRATGRAVSQHRVLAPGARSRIAATAAAHGTTTFNVVLAAVLRAQAARTGRPRTAVVVSVADRIDPVTTGVVGLVATAIPIWVDLSGDPDLPTAIARAADSSLAALENCVTMLTSGVASLSGVYGAPGPGYDPADQRSSTPGLELFVDGLDDTAVPVLQLPGATSAARAVTPPFTLTQGGLLTYLRLADDRSVLALLHVEGGIDPAAIEQILDDVQADLDA